MLVIGKREAEAGAVAIRLRTGEDLGAVPVEDAIDMMRKLNDTRSLELSPAVEA
jgi:threonyl-tRNA synthetase